MMTHKPPWKAASTRAAAGAASAGSYSLPSFSRSAAHNARPSRAPGSFVGIGRTEVWTMTSFDVGSTMID